MSLGAFHDFIEARSFAKIAVVDQAAVDDLIHYAEREASALLRSNQDVLVELAAALVEQGTLNGNKVDEVIERASPRDSSRPNRDAAPTGGADHSRLRD